MQTLSSMTFSVPSPSVAASPVLEVRNLGVTFATSTGPSPVVRNVSFNVHAGERIGLVGESGCGKTVTGLALMRLLPPMGTQVSGQVLFDGQDLLGFSQRRMRALRGRGIGMVFQEPMSALDPVFTVGEQIAEAYRAHFKCSRAEARERTENALAQVGIPLPRQRYDEYPHQLSGGMRQRVMIAMALICEPRLVIADEPTTALDVTVQAQITALLRDLSERTGTALLFITHDLGVVAETCTRMVTMYAGEVVEDAQVDSVLLEPRHPYTSGLLRSLPRFSKRKAPLGFVAGRVPAPQDEIAGCRFQTRCLHAQAECQQPQSLVALEGKGSLVRCIRAPQLTLPGVITP